MRRMKASRHYNHDTDMCEMVTRGPAPVPLDEWDGNTFSCRMGNLTHLPHHDLKSLKCQQTKDKIRKSHSLSVLTQTRSRGEQK